MLNLHRLVGVLAVSLVSSAIDDQRSANPEDVKTATSHLRVALDESLAGKPVTTAGTSPYGCSVKV